MSEAFVHLLSLPKTPFFVVTQERCSKMNIITHKISFHQPLNLLSSYLILVWTLWNRSS